MSSKCGRVSYGKVRLPYSHEKPQGEHLSHLTAPSRLNAEEYWRRTPQETARFVTQLLAQHPDVQFDQDSTPRIREMEDSSPGTNEWYLELKQQATAQAESGNIRTTNISVETQTRVLLCRSEVN